MKNKDLLLGIGDCVSRVGVPRSSSEAGSKCLPIDKSANTKSTPDMVAHITFLRTPLRTSWDRGNIARQDNYTIRLNYQQKASL